MAVDENHRKAPPRDNLVRGVFPADLEVRADTDDGAPTLFGHFSVFDTWTEINSMWEGQFMERIAPGAFKKTMRENRDGMRVLFQHGKDPQIGDKPIASIRELREDDVGAYYEAELFRSVPDLLMDGLRAGAYGASFRFRVMREEWLEDPDPTDENPRGLPERTIKEAQVLEMGPVTWGAYPTATAGVRSLTDEFLAAGRTAAESFTVGDTTSTTSTDVTFTAAPEPERTVDADEPEHTDAAPSHPPQDEARRDTQPETKQEEDKQMTSIEEMRSRLADIVTELKEIANENYGQKLDTAEDERWNSLVAEQNDIEERIADTERRQAYLDTITEDKIDKATVAPTRDREVFVTRQGRRNQLPNDVFAIEEYHKLAQSRDHFHQLTSDGARAAIETFHYPHPNADQAKTNEHLERLMQGDSTGEIVQRILHHGSPDYRAAYWKKMLNQPLSRQEQNALAAGMALEDRTITTSNTGGVTVPVHIDPTVIPVSNGVLNPVRQISNVVTTTSHQYQAVTSSGVTATRRSEGAAMADNAPTLVAPTIVPSRVDVFIPFSWEAAADWGALESQIAPLISDAKDVEEASAFANGSGTAPNPYGFMTHAGTVLGTAATVVIGTVDLLALQDALGPRFQANATWLMAPAMASKVRALTSTSQGSWWAESLQEGVPSRLLGYPIYRATNVGTAGGATSPPVASVKWAIIGDFRYFQIVDRVGLQTRYIDNLFSGNTAGSFGYPVGMSGLVAYYRNGSDVLTSNAFRVGTVT